MLKGIQFREMIMKIIAIFFIIVGVSGILMGGMMFGDIGVAAMIGESVGILSGLGFLKVNKGD